MSIYTIGNALNDALKQARDNNPEAFNLAYDQLDSWLTGFTGQENLSVDRNGEAVEGLFTKADAIVRCYY